MYTWETNSVHSCYSTTEGDIYNSVILSVKEEEWNGEGEERERERETETDRQTERRVCDCIKPTD